MPTRKQFADEEATAEDEAFRLEMHQRRWQDRSSGERRAAESRRVEETAARIEEAEAHSRLVRGLSPRGSDMAAFSSAQPSSSSPPFDPPKSLK